MSHVTRSWLNAQLPISTNHHPQAQLVAFTKMRAASVVHRNAYKLLNYRSVLEESLRSRLRCFSFVNARVHRVKGLTLASCSNTFGITAFNGHFNSWKRDYSAEGVDSVSDYSTGRNGQSVDNRRIMYEVAWNSRYKGMITHSTQYFSCCNVQY